MLPTGSGPLQKSALSLDRLEYILPTRDGPASKPELCLVYIHIQAKREVLPKRKSESANNRCLKYSFHHDVCCSGVSVSRREIHPISKC